MKAMILAAGLGTRLKPITNNIPKALVEVDGTPVLHHVILNLKKQGFDYIVVNVHHYSHQIIDYLNSQDFGLEIEISDETDQLLDTGGGIVNASPLIFKYNNDPVLIHNVDILSNADLINLMNNTGTDLNAASLLVSNRESSRKLLFDKEGYLTGWHDLKTNNYRMVGTPTSESAELSFSGIYSLTRDAIAEIKKLMGEGKYSIMDYFLNPKRETRVRGVEQTDLKLLDIGKPATLSQAHDLLKELNNLLN